MSIDVLKDRLPEYARDLRLNLSSLASEQLLSPQQKAGSFVAAALAANHEQNKQALVDALGLNLWSLASEQLLSPQQKAGSFVAAALAANHAPTTQAVVDAFGPDLTADTLEDAR